MFLWCLTPVWTLYYSVHMRYDMKKDINDSILTLRVPHSLIEAIDQAAKKAERERSDWIRRTLRKATEGKG